MRNKPCFGRLPTRIRRWGASERGAVTIQLVMLLPVLFGIVFLGLQAALYYYAATVAGAAAQDGARGGRALRGRRRPGGLLVEHRLVDGRPRDHSRGGRRRNGHARPA